MTAILGLDIGTKRIGVAIGDASVKIAHPVGTFLRAQGKAETQILTIVAERGVVDIVVGLPLNAQGQKTPQCENVENFCRRLERRAKVKIIFVDEYLSSQESEERLLQRTTNRKKPASGSVDRLAACEILQRFFNGDQ